MSEPTLRRAYAIPLLLGVLSVSGLVIALVCDGAIDVVAVTLVIVPIVVLARAFFRARAAGSPSQPTSPATTRSP